MIKEPQAFRPDQSKKMIFPYHEMLKQPQRDLHRTFPRKKASTW
jgi:hypothetical protein